MLPNMAAFLDTISHSEGTDNVRDSDGNPVDPYRVCYAKRHVIQDLSDHPAVDSPKHPAEWRGESLSSLGPRYAHDVSTAAGRYQINRPTWALCVAGLGLRDFTATSQDDAAIFLIKRAGGFYLVNSGQIADAITACRGIWASLPGGDSGQPQRSFAQLMDAYTKAGGAFA